MDAALIAKEMEALIGGNDEQTTVTHWLDTGYPPLNYALSGRYDGGMPVGRIVEMFGPPSSGKTAISVEVMKSAQKAGGIAAFMDHERTFDQRLAAMAGLDVKPGRFIFKTPRTFEESIAIAVKVGQHVREKKLIDQDAPIAFIFDSLASMVPKSKMDKGVDEYNMNDTTALARVTSSVFAAFATHAEELGIMALFLNQQRTKPGVVYGDPTTTPGGEGPKYYASIRLQLGAKRIKKGDEIIGQEVGCKVVKNKVARPFQTAAWKFVFQPDGTGKFDTIGSLIDFMAANKLIETSGSRVMWDGKSMFRSQVAEIIEKEGRLGELIAMLPAHVEPCVEIPEGEEGGWEAAT
jgi:recombination protein RecA